MKQFFTIEPEHVNKHTFAKSILMTETLLQTKESNHYYVTKATHKVTLGENGLAKLENLEETEETKGQAVLNAKIPESLTVDLYGDIVFNCEMEDYTKGIEGATHFALNNKRSVTLRIGEDYETDILYSPVMQITYTLDHETLQFERWSDEIWNKESK